MESKFMKRHAHMVKMTRQKIQKKQKLLEQNVNVIKELVSKDDSVFYIVNYVPGKVAEIEKLTKELRQLEEQLSMLVWMTDEEDDF